MVVIEVYKAKLDANKKLKSGTIQAKCLASHKPLDSDSYVFTLKQLQGVARK